MKVLEPKILASDAVSFVNEDEMSTKMSLMQKTPIKIAKEEVPDSEKSMNAIAKQIPAMEALERKVPELKKLKPELESLADKLDDITDMSDMRAAREGGRTIKAIFKVSNDVEKDSAVKNAEINTLHIAHKNFMVNELKQVEPSPAPSGESKTAAAQSGTAGSFMATTSQANSASS